MNRIKKIAQLIPNDSIIADIGCDHAYLAIELFKLNKLKFAYLIDNKEGPIKNALKNIDKYKLNNKCKIIKTNGLNFNFDKKMNKLIFKLRKIFPIIMIFQVYKLINLKKILILLFFVLILILMLNKIKNKKIDLVIIHHPLIYGSKEKFLNNDEVKIKLKTQKFLFIVFTLILIAQIMVWMIL